MMRDAFWHVEITARSNKEVKLMDFGQGRIWTKKFATLIRNGPISKTLHFSMS